MLCTVVLATFQVTDTFEKPIKIMSPVIPKMYICTNFFIFQGFLMSDFDLNVNNSDSIIAYTFYYKMLLA